MDPSTHARSKRPNDVPCRQPADIHLKATQPPLHPNSDPQKMGKKVSIDRLRLALYEELTGTVPQSACQAYPRC